MTLEKEKRVLVRGNTTVKCARCALAVAIGTMLSCFSTAVDADTIQSTYNGTSPAKSARYSLNGSAFTGISAGLFNWTRTGGTYAGDGAEGEYLTFCIELTEGLGIGNSYTFDVVDVADAPNSLGGMGATNADLLSQLWGQFFDASFDANHAAGFQLAVWDIVYDDDFNVSAGDFQVENVALFVDIANDFLSNLDDAGPRADLLAKTGRNIQDQIFVVPAPGAMALFGIAGLLVLTARRNRV